MLTAQLIHFFWEGKASQAVQEAVQQTSSTLPTFPLALHFQITASPQVAVVTETVVSTGGGFKWSSWDRTKIVKPKGEDEEAEMIVKFIKTFCEEGYIHGRKK